jgi:putative hydrolase of the HAD superfamily
VILIEIGAVIFDLGGTLINYEGLALCWGDYYKDAFESLKEKLKIDLSEKIIEESIQILKKYNSRLYPREIEYKPEYIFSNVTSGWDIKEMDIHILKNIYHILEEVVVFV